MNEILKGIYKLENIETGNVYIGQSKNIGARFNWHKKDLIEGKHHQKNIQKEFNEQTFKVRQKLKDNELYDYIDIKSYVFDKFYKITPIFNMNDDYNEDKAKEIEDKFILEFREIQDGYFQLTNKEIKENYENKHIFYEKLNKVEKNISGIFYKSVSEMLYLLNKNGDMLIVDIPKADLVYKQIDWHLRTHYFAYFINTKSSKHKRNEYEFKTSFSEIIDFTRGLQRYRECERELETMKDGLTCSKIKQILKIFKGVKVETSNMSGIKLNDEITIKVDRTKFNNELFSYYDEMIKHKLVGLPEGTYEYIDKNNENLTWYFHQMYYKILKLVPNNK